METKIRITKCYLVELTDDVGNELSCEYSFVSRDDAKRIGERLRREYEEQEQNYE